MRHKSTLNGLLAAIVIAGLSRGIATADIVVPRATDTAEHAAMMKLASIVRRTDYNKTVDLSKERPEWKYAPMMQMKLAFAQFKLNTSESDIACKATCEDLISKCVQSDPVAAAWARVFIIRCLERPKYHQRKRTTNYNEVLDRSLEVITSCNTMEDLTPVLAAQRGIGWLLHLHRKTFKEGIENEPLAAAAAKRPDANALIEMARCADWAERGEMEKADARLLTLKKILPEGDRRIALASTGLVMSACYAFDRDPKANLLMLSYCEQIIPDLEEACPKEKWLIARARLSFAGAVLRSRADNKKAESNFREVVDNKSAPDLLPEAYTQLGNTLYVQQKYAEASKMLTVVVDSYPYSSWVDFAAYLRADCAYRLGQKQEAVRLLDEFISNYPNSGWSSGAKTLKELVSK